MATTPRRRGRGEGSIYQRADGKWVGSIDLGWQDGKRVRKVLYGKTRREVAGKVTALIPQAAAGQVTTGKPPTVEAWLDSWLAAATHRLAPKTHASYAWIAEAYLIPDLGPIRLDKLTPTRIQATLSHLLDKGLSPRSVQYAHAVLRIALGQAAKLGLIRENPAVRVDSPRPRREALAALTAEEARKLLDAAPEERYGPLFVLALTSGLRQGELLVLRWRDVDLEAGVLHVRQGKTHRSRRTIPLTEVARRALGDAGEPEALVFPSRAGTPIGPRNLVRAWHRFCEDTLGRRVRFHDLRHTAATLMLAQGVPLKVISDLLGHSSIQVTSDIYTEVVDALKADAASRMDGIFAAQPKLKGQRKRSG